MTATPSDTAAARLAGTWVLVCSTFPLWRNGRRAQPTFGYTPLPEARSGAARLRDEVAYTVRGRRRRIVGTDTRIAGRPGAVFRWRGRGPLAVLSSVWEVGEFAEDGTWAAITFTRSLVTPAGTDIVLRETARGDASALDAALAAGHRLGAPPLPGVR